jgi:myo-inositol-1(or 4)-monophosphatase
MAEDEIVRELTTYIRDKVRPHLGMWHARAITGTANSGDATFAIDVVAEEAIVEFIQHHDLSVAYYSEDRGLIKFGANPGGVLVIDPIDGTRPALAGFEQCVVSVSWSKYTDQVTMDDVQYGCIAELKGDDIFYAARGRGAVWVDGTGTQRQLNLSKTVDLSRAPLSFEAVARPFEYLGVVLNDIINAASTRGGCYLINSTAYSLTRLLTGQLSAVIDVGNRIMRDHPWTRDKFIEIGKGKALGIFTYDIAAAALIASEAGAIITDAYGKTFSDVPLLDTSESNLQTICAASTQELHEELLRLIEAGSNRLLIQTHAPD